jgi:hypothetical protein
VSTADTVPRTCIPYLSTGLPFDPWIRVEALAPPAPRLRTGCPSTPGTLPTSEQPLRVAEWDRLFAASLHTVEYARDTVGRARLVLSGDDGLAGHVQQLADAETACCSFFTFTVTSLDARPVGGTVVALDIDVPPNRFTVLAALVARAERAHRAPS